MAQWPTPTQTLGTNGARSEPRDATNGPNLHEAVLWPTPHGMGSPEDPHGSELSMAAASAEGLSTSERSAKRAGLWPTPRAEDCEQTGAHRGVPDTLTSAARTFWPTATAGDAKASGSRTTENSAAHPGISLTDAAVHGLSIDDTAGRVWSTPSAHEPRLGYQRRPEGMASQQNQQSLTTEVYDEAGLPPPEKSSTNGKPAAPSRMLNADWVLQLMGYPRTWARLSTGRGSRPQATPSSHSSPKSSDAP